jgi:hypothetical protein
VALEDQVFASDSQIIVDDPSGNPVELFKATLPVAHLGSHED